MNNLLIKSADTTNYSVKQFKDNLFFFRADSDVPFAARAPLDAAIPKPLYELGNTVYETESFRIAKDGNCIYCSISKPDAPLAVISLFDSGEASCAIDSIKSYLSRISSIDLSRIAVSADLSVLMRLIGGIADYCGCLTDINDPEYPIDIRVSRYEKNTPYLAAVLPTVCLLYRRLSALRGFNFKPIYPEGLPCLAFSARIISEGIASVSDIPEYSALLELDNNGEITVFSKLVPEPDDDGEKISRLTLIISVQSRDPSGVLHATEWKKNLRERLDITEIDITGRF